MSPLVLRPRALAAVAAGAAALLVGVGVLGAAVAAPHPAATASARRLGPVVRVVRQDLVVTTDLTAALGHGDPVPVRVKRSGTITRLPAVGAVLHRDSVLLRVDDRPVPVLIGDLPLWRPVGDAGQHGDDVAMVAANLEALHLLHARYTAATTVGPAFRAALRQWQRRHGMTASGRLAPADAVVLAGTSRVAAVSAHLGDPASGDVLTVTPTDRIVTADVPAAQGAALRAGLAVTVVLPDDARTPGSVRSVGTVADGDAGAAKVHVVVTLRHQSAATRWDAAPVELQVPQQRRDGVLTVPVAALLALRDGGTALQRPDGTLLAVETGLFADDRVEVTGAGVAAGLTVVTAP